MARLVVLLLLLVAPLAAPTAAPEPTHGQGTPEPGISPLLTEPMTEAWRAKLVLPLVSRLRPLGLYAAAETTPAAMAGAMQGAPNALALLRRSSYGATLPGVGFEAIEIGPAACLLLAVRADRPWAAYADLNYAEGDLRVVTSGPLATGLLGSLTAVLPLSAPLASEERPLRVAFQHLLRGEVDLVAFDAPRRSTAQTPALTAELALERGLRLLAMPTLPEPAVLSPGTVQLGAASWMQAAPTQATVCDPFVLVLRDDRADKLLHHLYDSEAAAAAANPSPSFTAQVQEAARSLVSLIGSAAGRL